MTEPGFWKKLRRYGGLPIPFIAPREGARPLFSLKNLSKMKQCGMKRLCGICGQHIDGPMAFVGGSFATKSAFFHEPPFHEECARASFAVCPYLNKPNDEKFITIAKAVKTSVVPGSVGFQASGILRVYEFESVKHG